MATAESVGAGKEHLFISYASEDWVFADWLALKLASEGYKVWYDRIKLLGGESYPRDITAAIKNQTFARKALQKRLVSRKMFLSGHAGILSQSFTKRMSPRLAL